MFWERIWTELQTNYLAPDRLAVYAGKLFQVIVIVAFASLTAWLLGRFLGRRAFK